MSASEGSGAGNSTRERLLDAAEKLFADFGFNGVSVRQIVAAANVNLSGVPYYFGTKENLFKSVLMRRALPMREARRKRIDELYASDPKPSLENVLYAMLEPASRTNRENEYFSKLLGRASMDPTPEIRALLDDIYTDDFMVVPRELRRSLSGLPAEEFFWKLNCLYGVMLFVQADTGKIQTIAGAEFDTSRPDVALKYVVPFLAAGLRAAVGRKAAAPKARTEA
jgi:AcrR family transcriptional regulator